MKWFPLFLLLLGWVAPGRLEADGKVFPPTAIPTEVRIPDQRALLSWSNGVERLIIETRFTGAGNQFAWVVPLPAPPVVEPASRGLFPTLLHLTAPRVVHAPPNVWLAAVVSGGFLILAIARHWTLGKVLTVLAILAIAAGMLLPSLATAKAGGGPGSSVEILDRQLAGVFESTTLTAKDPSALREWLVREGYRMPPEVEPVVAAYVREGWVFVASKVRRDTSDAAPAAMHPLSFTFPSPEPVYPLRLTGVGNGDLEVELFVLGPGTATCPGFQVEDSRPTGETPDEYYGNYWPRSHLSLRHEALFAAAAGAPWATRLRGVLSPARMTADAVLRWEPAREQHRVLYSLEGACRTLLNVTVPALTLVVVVLVWGVRWRGWQAPAAWRRGVLAATAAAAVTAAGVAALPRVPVRLEKRYRAWSDARNLQLAVQMAVREGLDTNGPVTVVTVREAIRRELPAIMSQFQGRPLSFKLREEDAPYMYSLRARTNGVDLIFHDAMGGERERIALPESP